MSKAVDVVREARALDMLTDDPMTFLVAEQIIKAKARERVQRVTPLRYMFSFRKAEYDQEKASYLRVCAICDRKFEEVVRRALTVKVDTALLDHELKLKRRKRYEKHQDDLQELRYQQELEIERMRIQGASHEERMRYNETVNEELAVSSEAEAERMVAVTKRANQAHLEYQRGLFQAIAETELKMDHRNQQRLAEMEHDFQLRLALITPDKSDPAYLAQRQQAAFEVYAKMAQEIQDNPNMDSDQKNREISLIIKMATKG